MTSEARVLSIRTLYLTMLYIGIACAAAVVAHILTSLVNLVTNFAYYDRFSLAEVVPSGHHLGIWTVVIPVAGGLLVGVGVWLGNLAVMLLPHAQIDIRIAALAGMTTLFAGASRALPASLVCGLEITQQPSALLPLLAGCSSSYRVGCLLVQNSLMTEKLVAKEMPVPAGYGSDALASALVSSWATRLVLTTREEQTVQSARKFLTSGIEDARHCGYRVMDADGQVIGLLRPCDLLATTLEANAPLRVIAQPCPTISPDRSLREAVEIMGAHDVGYLPCVTDDTGTLVGMLTCSDIFRAQAQLAGCAHTRYRHLPLNKLTPRKRTWA